MDWTVRTTDDLDRLVKHHLCAEHAHKLAHAVKHIPPAFTETVRKKFLVAVVNFNNLNIHTEKKTRDWMASYAAFQALTVLFSNSGQLGFYILNYAYISGVMAGQDRSEIELHYSRAESMAKLMAEPYKSHALGVLLEHRAYHMEQLSKNKDTPEDERLSRKQEAIAMLEEALVMRNRYFDQASAFTCNYAADSVAGVREKLESLKSTPEKVSST